MSFGENLKQIRKEHCLSQEELAELLNVSRQAVSKWEQDLGYPEVETLLLLAEKLHVSLDALMDTGSTAKSTSQPDSAPFSAVEKLVITSPHENVVVSCYKVQSSGKMRGGKGSPQYALFGVSRGLSSFWGEPTTFLGWYADREKISREIEEIQKAIAAGAENYTLQFSARTDRRWARVKIIEE